ncbi:hypothetical protein BDN72DRAFT_864283 [Pluteus cervinus]|uniref:Uncharacterized protein n=1 Tax=Pluteus cervinus TaxID=181527 RepID=A0ACD3A4C1_9AGAR|nr:hypothetical protein BDN72DRAFT_864283 [Pluteus cervinus]
MLPSDTRDETMLPSDTLDETSATEPSSSPDPTPFKPTFFAIPREFSEDSSCIIDPPRKPVYTSMDIPRPYTIPSFSLSSISRGRARTAFTPITPPNNLQRYSSPSPISGIKTISVSPLDRLHDNEEDEFFQGVTFRALDAQCDPEYPLSTQDDILIARLNRYKTCIDALEVEVRALRWVTSPFPGIII